MAELTQQATPSLQGGTETQMSKLNNESLQCTLMTARCLIVEQALPASDISQPSSSSPPELQPGAVDIVNTSAHHCPSQAHPGIKW